jgi:hypothetical protein
MDDRDNLLFSHRDGPGMEGVCGFEKKSCTFTGFSTGGTRATANTPPGATIVLATDNDDAGEKLAAKIAALAGSATVVRDPSPVGKDWND